MAMGITQALKLQKGSLREIAELPQQYIISMAQKGMLPAAMVPMILSEKAQMAKEAQNAKAMLMGQQPPPPTVTEQNMQTIQGAEDEEAMRRRMMAGVGSLPVQDDTFRAAGGGIVAFAGGGDLPEDEEEEPVDIVAPSATYESQLARAKKSLALPEEAQAYLKYLEGQSARNATQAEQDKYMNLINLGAQIMSSKSPYALSAIGEGVSQGMPAFIRSAQAQRAAEAEALKNRAQVALSRGQAEADLASKLYGTEAGLAKAEIAAQAKIDAAEIAKKASGSLTGNERMAYNFAKNEGRKRYKKAWDDLTDDQREELLAIGQEKVLTMVAETRNQPALARLPLEETRAGTDVEEAISKDIKNNEKLYQTARLPIDENASPALKKKVEEAKEAVRVLEAKHDDMRRRAGIQTAPSKKAEAPAKIEPAPAVKKPPSLSEFLDKARKANPGVKDADLEAYWKKTYGR